MSVITIIVSEVEVKGIDDPVKYVYQFNKDLNTDEELINSVKSKVTEGCKFKIVKVVKFKKYESLNYSLKAKKSKPTKKSEGRLLHVVR